jgi:hypothetical protein
LAAAGATWNMLLLLKKRLRKEPHIMKSYEGNI